MDGLEPSKKGKRTYRIDGSIHIVNIKVLLVHKEVNKERVLCPQEEMEEIPCKAASKDPFQRLYGILVLYDKISHLQSVYDHRGRKYWFSCPRSKIGRLHDQTIEVN